MGGGVVIDLCFFQLREAFDSLGKDYINMMKSPQEEIQELGRIINEGM
jgi:hypothetical protein